MWNRFHQKLYTDTQETQTDSKPIIQGPLLILPQKILINILLFLDFHKDIPNIIETCRFMQNIINSEVFQVKSFNSWSHHPNKTTIQNLQKEEQKNSSNLEDTIKTKAEAILSIKKVVAVNNFVSNKIASQDKKIDELTKELNKATEDLRINKNITNKGLEKYYRKEKEYNDVHKALQNTENEIFYITSSESSELENLKNKYEKVSNENVVLDKHCRILACELMELEHKAIELESTFTAYETAVDRMNEYFMMMFVPKIDVIINKSSEDVVQ
ncbi:hypothetical protein SteCoe_7896 [Stentor coeruleus]|uniref:F-box domain-containing protein n=1 Tax=Stentor coeruleus TaxID=5963 RepID=A0A1R2CLR6_9CILI|nr:hypothetical protein SteCoe_7896 [Stentor coeruleus]